MISLLIFFIEIFLFSFIIFSFLFIIGRLVIDFMYDGHPFLSMLILAGSSAVVLSFILYIANSKILEG